MSAFFFRIRRRCGWTRSQSTKAWHGWLSVPPGETVCAVHEVNLAPGFTVITNGISASADTLLRSVRRMASAPVASPRVIGVYDWAMRRGKHYGSIIVDLKRSRPNWIPIVPNPIAEPARQLIGFGDSILVRFGFQQPVAVWIRFR